MRGGISYIAKRHSKANIKYMQSCNVNEPSKFIMYLDATFIFGQAMSQYLSYGGFKWLNKKINKFDVNSIECNCIDQQILEVDLEYPDKLHEMHNDYPLVPTKKNLIMICYQIILVIFQMAIE